MKSIFFCHINYFIEAMRENSSKCQMEDETKTIKRQELNRNNVDIKKQKNSKK